MHFIEGLIKYNRDAARNNPEVETASVCLLRPDHFSLWEAAISNLQEDLSELLIFCGYNSDKLTGLDIWLRCIAARVINELNFIERKPIIYL